MPLTMEQALEVIEDGIQTVANGRRIGGLSSYSSYGADLYLPVLADNLGLQRDTAEHTQAVTILAEAALFFVNRGILRPGDRRYNDPNAGRGVPFFGFSLTQFGHDWITREAPLDIPVGDARRMSALFQEHQARFGENFIARAEEAVRCYHTRNYLACCVMAGAAAESVLLQMVVAKVSDEAEVTRRYANPAGRGWLERQLTGGQGISAQVVSTFRVYFDLLKYWRDNSAHGAISNVAETEAFTAVLTLARLAQHVDGQWVTLTAPAPTP